jgi:hypothetical protein
MNVRWFPCRWCGDATTGVDSYVVCTECVEDFDLRVRADGNPYSDSAQTPITSEVEARLRRLLIW